MKNIPKDRMVLSELKRAGSDLFLPHHVRHYLYFPLEKQAKKAAQKLQTTGYETKVRLGADAINWVVLASHLIVPTEQAILDVRSNLKSLPLSCMENTMDGRHRLRDKVHETVSRC